MFCENFGNIFNFVMNHTEIVTFPILPEIRLRVLTEKSEFFYAKESELLKFGIKDPFFLFCWPGGQALSRFILDNRILIKDKSVLVFGSGCGTEGIAAVLCGAKYVLASDIDVNALLMSSINMELNNVRFELTDKDMFLSDCEGFDVVLAGDMFYDSDMIKTVFDWLRKLKAKNKLVLCADPSRGNVAPESVEVLNVYETIKDGEIHSGKVVKTTVFTVR
ncbi:MAG: 50S ribosomal protein L11 methyltransferase [Deltaproteobacteria bacterium]|nr:50S ribosomal protein L11 methyltransferase [Deltaproteobacteria bacterium]